MTYARFDFRLRSIVAGGAKGSLDGVGPRAQFNNPEGIAVASDGTIYISDTQSNTLRMVTPDGTVSTIAGAVGETGAVDGDAASSLWAFREASRLTLRVWSMWWTQLTMMCVNMTRPPEI